MKSIVISGGERRVSESLGDFHSALKRSEDTSLNDRWARHMNEVTTRPLAVHESDGSMLAATMNANLG
jgi:hypothetical protein